MTWQTGNPVTVTTTASPPPVACGTCGSLSYRGNYAYRHPRTVEVCSHCRNELKGAK